MTEETIRVLAVRQPWASLIVEGLKTIEVRSRNTNVRERVAIYASTHRPTKKELSGVWRDLEEMVMAKNGVLTLDDEARIKKLISGLYTPTYTRYTGKILGSVEITHSGEMTATACYALRKHHFAPTPVNTVYGWDLVDPVKFPEPIPLEKWPSGGPWARIPKSMLPGV